MLQDVKPLSFIQACRTFFGYRPGEGLREFSAEIKELTPSDRKDLTEWFEQIGTPIKGVTTTPPTSA